MTLSVTKVHQGLEARKPARFSNGKKGLCYTSAKPLVKPCSGEELSEGFSTALNPTVSLTPVNVNVRWQLANKTSASPCCAASEGTPYPSGEKVHLVAPTVLLAP